MRRFLPAAALTLAPLALAACGRSPAATFLTIDPAPPAAAAGAAGAAVYAGPPLRVPFVHVPVTLDRVEFTSQPEAGRVKVDDFARWAAPLGRLARDVLIRDLTQRLPSGEVLPPDAASAKRETLLSVTVLDYAAAGGTATMTVSYQLGTSLAPTVAQFQAPLADATPAASARAWGTLMGQLADRVAGELPTTQVPPR